MTIDDSIHRGIQQLEVTGLMGRQAPNKNTNEQRGMYEDKIILLIMLGFSDEPKSKRDIWGFI